jgi:hypothetical protein
MRANPRKQTISIKGTASDAKDGFFRGVHRRIQLEPVQDQKGLERGVTHALVAVNERMVRY